MAWREAISSITFPSLGIDINPPVGFTVGLLNVQFYGVIIAVGLLLAEKKATVQVLHSPDKWFGVTYAEDKPLVVASFKELIDAGEYNADLFSDL